MINNSADEFRINPDSPKTMEMAFKLRPVSYAEVRAQRIQIMLLKKSKCEFYSPQLRCNFAL